MGYDFDLVVIGGGPAGEKAAQTAARLGKRVLLIERQPEPGGAAVHTGTLPSKTLRETALFISGFRQRELYGVSIQIDRAAAVPKLLARKDAVRDSEVARIRWDLEQLGVTILRGNARLASQDAVEVETGREKRLRFETERILVATGSSPFKPANIPFEDHDIDDSDSILLLDRLPATLTILGAGVIGCEYASIFAALGVRVTLIEARDRLLPFLDAEITDRLRIALGRLGIDVRLGTAFTAVARDGDSIAVTLASGDRLHAEKLLFTAGRQGNTRGLNLEAVGVAPDKRGYVPVDAFFRTAVPSIYAAGDVVGIPALASTSMEQGRIAARHAFGAIEQPGIPTLLPYGIYTIPEVSCVGETEESCRQKGLAYEVGRAFFRDNARAKIVGDKDGVLKLLFAPDHTHRLLGIHILGDRASELVHIGQFALHRGGGIDTFLDMVFNYPTLADCYKDAAYDGLARLARRRATT